MFIHARDLREFLATGAKKRFPAAHSDFFNRLEAIRDKCRANHEQIFHMALREFRQFKIRVRLEPRVLPQARLKGNGVFPRRHVRLGHERCDGLEALRTVTCRMGEAGDFAAISTGQTMTMGRIGFSQVSFRYSMETEQQMVITTLPTGLCAGNERLDVIRRIIIWWL